MKKSLKLQLSFLCVAMMTMLSCAQDSIYDSLWKAEEYFNDPQLVALCKAIERADLNEIERLVRVGADVNARGKDTMTPLLWGYPMGEKVLEKLLELGGDPNTQYDGEFGTGATGHIQPGDSLLFIAIKGSGPGSTVNRERFQNYIDLLLKHGADPNQIQAIFKIPPLRSAITFSATNVAEKLIQAGADVDWRGNSGRPLVSYAADRHAYAILRLLLDHGADYRSIDKTNGQTVVHAFVSGSRYQLLNDNSEFGRQYREIVAWFEKRGMSIERARDQWEQWKAMDKSGGTKAAVARYIAEVSEPEVARWLPPGVEPGELPEEVHREIEQHNNVRLVAPPPAPLPPPALPEPPQDNAWDIASIAILVVLLLFIIGIALLFLYPYNKKKL